MMWEVILILAIMSVETAEQSGGSEFNIFLYVLCPTFLINSMSDEPFFAKMLHKTEIHVTLVQLLSEIRFFFYP